MRPSVKLAAFGLVLLATFGSGLAVGAAAGPFEDDEPPVHVEHTP